MGIINLYEFKLGGPDPVLFFDFAADGLLDIITEFMSAATIIPMPVFITAILTALMHQYAAVAIMTYE